MKRHTLHDIIDALRDLTDRAEQFVNRAPQSKRLATERQALLDAITTAQLVLSVHQKLSEEEGTPGPSKERPPRK
jgi:hypothetical protein